VAAESSATRLRITFGYRTFRALARLGIGMFYRPTRRLNADSFPSAGAALAVVSHSAGFLQALLLVAALDRQIHCRLERRLVRGMGRRLLAWGLGMIVVSESAGAETAGTILSGGEAVAVFAETPELEGGARPGFPLAARLAAAEASNPSGAGLQLIPVHLYLPADRTAGSEMLVHFDHPLDVGSFLAGADASRSQSALAAALEKSCRQNVFRIHPDDVGHFLADVEEVSKSDLAEDWSERRNWLQQAEGFRISGFVAEWVERLNLLQPGLLVSMRERLSIYHQAQRRAALRRLKVETAGEWIKSPWRRGAVWAETFLTFPVAFYGLVNYLMASVLLYAAGLTKSSSAGRQLERRTRWTVGALVILACYAGQILLCAHLWGRAAAGIYALTLPVSGLDLWRYAWLLGRRTGLLVLRGLGQQDARSLRRRRKQFLKEMDAARRAQAEAPGLAH
jgi:hypothetical protein